MRFFVEGECLRGLGRDVGFLGKLGGRGGGFEGRGGGPGREGLLGRLIGVFRGREELVGLLEGKRTLGPGIAIF